MLDILEVRNALYCEKYREVLYANFNHRVPKSSKVFQNSCYILILLHILKVASINTVLFHLLVVTSISSFTVMSLNNKKIIMINELKQLYSFY